LSLCKPVAIIHWLIKKCVNRILDAILNLYYNHDE
jgi:hypothetical protein